MTERVIGPTGSPRRRWTLLLPLVAVFAFGLFYIAGAQAVDDAGVFQLDGNAQTSVDSTPTAAEDWDLICKDNPSTCTFKSSASPGGTTTATSSSHEDDGALDATIFHGSSKDPGDISSWRWKDGAGGLPDKDNLLHAYAARYTKTANASCPNGPGPTFTGDCSLIYFGSDRYANDGDATQAFWFLQNKVTLSNRTSNGGSEFDGVHRNGDILVISEFSNGGTTSTITVYKWLNGGLTFVTGGPNQKCGGGTADAFCGIVNESATPTFSPWTFTDKDGSTNFRQGEFFEAGINLSDPAIALADECFSSFVAETRSSTSTTATLKDFVLGQFEVCGASLSTMRSQSSIVIGSSLTDTATIAVTGGSNPPAPTGTVSFYVCGPSATSCAVNGTAFDTKLLSGAVKTGNSYAVTSAPYTPTTAGTYCFAASWPGDSNYIGPFRDDGANECFTVTPKTPTIFTTHSPTTSSALGTATSDTATIGNTANKPDGSPASGTVQFKLYGPRANPATANCTNNLVYTSAAYAVSGNGTYPTGQQDAATFLPTVAGTYDWQATYSGDLPNTSGPVSSVCGAEPVTLIKLQPSISTAQRFVPNDSATITVGVGGGNLLGSVRFRLYTASDCTGSTLIDQTVPVSGASQQTVGTTNTTAITATQTNLSWLVEYTSTNASHHGVVSSCTNEVSSLTINDGSSSTTTFP